MHFGYLISALGVVAGFFLTRVVAMGEAAAQEMNYGGGYGYDGYGGGYGYGGYDDYGYGRRSYRNRHHRRSGYGRFRRADVDAKEATAKVAEKTEEVNGEGRRFDDFGFDGGRRFDDFGFGYGYDGGYGYGRDDYGYGGGRFRRFSRFRR